MKKTLIRSLLLIVLLLLAVVLGPGDFLPVLVGDEHWLWAGACHVGSCYFAAYLWSVHPGQCGAGDSAFGSHPGVYKNPCKGVI